MIKTKNYTENKMDALDSYPLRASKKTIKKMEQWESIGYRFVSGNNYKLAQTIKWSGYDCIKIAQTNSMQHGKCVATMWAVKVK